VAEALWLDLLRESQTKIAQFNCILGVLLLYTVVALESTRLGGHTIIDHFASCLFACRQHSLQLLILDSTVFESQISHSVVLESIPPLCTPSYVLPCCPLPGESRARSHSHRRNPQISDSCQDPVALQVVDPVDRVTRETTFSCNNDIKQGRYAVLPTGRTTQAGISRPGLVGRPGRPGISTF
jgi:hypothetical protein